MEQLNELAETLIDAGSGMRDIVADGADILKNDGDLGEYFRKHSGDILGNVKELAQAAATYLPGLPVNNLEAYLLGIVKWVSPELGTAYDDLFADIGKDDLSGMTGGALETRIEHILEDRKISQSNETARVLAELYEAGLREAVPSDTPKSITVDSEERTLSTYQKQVYDTAWGEVVSSGLDELVGSERFESAEAETQEKMIKKLYSYAAEQAKAAVFEDYKVETSVLKNEDIIAAGGSIALCAAWDASVKDMKSAQKAQLLKGWELSDQVKKAIFRNKISDSREETISEIESTGVSFDRFLNAYSAYSEINSLDLDANRKALKFALWVSSQGYGDGQAKVIRDELAFYNMATASAKNFEELTESGMEAEDAYDLSEELGSLQAEEGVSVSHIQRWRASVDFSDDVEKQLISLSVTMTDKQFQKVEIANDFGVKPDSYVKFYEVRDQYNSDGKSGFTQAEVKAVIDGEFADLSTKQKAVLWQLMNSSTSSAKNNPYSRDVGQQVLDAKAAAKAAAEEKDTMGSFSDEVNRQILNKW